MGCLIVGVGASAGGLEAFTQLLKALPPDTGLGFVLVQHLDPEHESALPQILTRATAMPVHEVTDRLRVEANHVYIIPPNTSPGIEHGVLKLQPRVRTRTPARSIDAFLESLAHDRHERAIGVILSGSANDGTLGLEAIKAEGGITFAQDASARYASMPRSAVSAGCVDFVLPPEGIARELTRIARHPLVADRPPAIPARAKPAAVRPGRVVSPARGSAPAEQRLEPGYAQILQLLLEQAGVDFSLYKSATVHRRILRRMVLNRQGTPAHYAGFLRRNPGELDALCADALINVTSFFRNPEAFEVLRRRVFPALLKQRNNDPLRVWVPGCSTGQEAYSIAMVFAELTEEAARPRRLQVFATDLNEANLEKARHGLYARTLVRDVPPARLRRFFVEEDAGFRIVKPLREQVVFARQNLISDPPFSRMDFVSCRNLLIYLEPEAQNKALLNFHYAVNPGGLLFLGASESIGSLTDLFAPVDKKQKIFSRQPAPTAGTSRCDDTSATFVRCAELEGELAETRDYLQSVLEDQASANEELTTVNEEVVHRNTELNRLNTDLLNLQMSTRLGLVLLGGDLSIRRFSPPAERQFNLRASDVGRPLGSVRHTLQCPDLEALIADVIAQGRETEREVQDNDGHWFSLRVRPYVTLDQKVDGAVLVLVDIDDLKRKERLIREEHEHAEAIIHTVPSALVILSDDLCVQSANETFYHTFKLSAADTTGHSIFELDHGSWDIPRLRHLLEDIIPRNSVFNDFEFTHPFARLGRRSLQLNARLLNNPGGGPKEILLGIHDITERRRARNALDAAQAQLASRAKQLEHAVAARTSELTAANAELKRAVRGSRDMQEKLRQLTHQFISEQEEQRRSISRELHDEVVQTLIGINVELAALRHDSSGDPRTVRARIARTQRLVENSVNTVHQFARELRPAMLDDLGLIPALHTYCKSLTERKKLRIHLTAFAGVEALGNAERTALYRVAQEALANVDRHARATLAKVSVTEILGAVRMEISDNGKAFDVARTLGQKNPKRLGLVGMTERIEMVGGTLTVASQRGTGTTVRAEIPFKGQEKKS